MYCLKENKRGCIRILLLAAIISLLQGCFFIIPTGLIVRAIKGPTYCVSTAAYVGSKVRMNNGKTATVTKIKGPTSDCPNALLPIGAEVTFDTDGTSNIEKPVVKQDTAPPIKSETQKTNAETLDKLHEGGVVSEDEYKRAQDKIEPTQTDNTDIGNKLQELDDLHNKGILSEEDYNKAKKRLTELQKLNELRQNGTLTEEEYNKAKARLTKKKNGGTE